MDGARAEASRAIFVYLPGTHSVVRGREALKARRRQPTVWYLEEGSMIRNALVIAVAAVTLAGSSGAQAAAAASGQAKNPPAPAKNPPAPAPAAARPRIGYAGTPTPPPAPAPRPVLQPVYVYSPDGYVVTYGAPYEVLSDGSVLVNFGYGNERVLRQCASSSNQTQVNQNGRDALGRILDPPGIAALKAGSRGQATGAQPPRDAAACYRADQQGRVEMVTERATGVRR